MDTIYCLFCGQSNSLSSMQCKSCGKPLPRVKGKDPEKKSQIIPIAPPHYAAQQHSSGDHMKSDTVRRALEKIASDYKNGGSTEKDYNDRIEELTRLVESIRDDYLSSLVRVRHYKEHSSDDIYNYLDIYEIEAKKHIENFAEYFSHSIDCMKKIPQGAFTHYLEEAIENALQAAHSIELLDRLTDETDAYMKQVEERISEKAVE